MANKEQKSNPNNKKAAKLSLKEKRLKKQENINTIGYHTVNKFNGHHVNASCILSGSSKSIQSNWLIPVTSREPPFQ